MCPAGRAHDVGPIVDLPRDRISSDEPLQIEVNHMADDRSKPTATSSSAPHVDPAVELSERRTGMSFQRTRMSADRTLMSVIRTSLSLISFGFTIAKAFEKLRETG